MSLVTPSDLDTNQSYIPVIKDGNQEKIVGVPQVYDTVAALKLKVVNERARNTNGNFMWKHRLPITVGPEPGNRVWHRATGSSNATNATNSHAKTVQIESLEFVLGSDDNVVLSAAGIPAGATGAVGDASVDLAARIVYLKTGATTWVAKWKINSKVPVASVLTGAVTLPLSAMACVTPYNGTSAAALTLPLAADAWALQPFGIIEVFIQNTGIPTFAVQSGQTAIRDGGGAGAARYRSLIARVISATEWAVMS